MASSISNSLRAIGLNCKTPLEITPDNKIDAIKLTMIVTGTTRTYSAEILRELKEEVFSQSKFIPRSRPTGGYPTKLLTIDDAIELVMVLPGTLAKQIRLKFVDIIKQHLENRVNFIYLFFQCVFEMIIDISFLLIASAPLETRTSRLPRLWTST